VLFKVNVCPVQIELEEAVTIGLLNPALIAKDKVEDKLPHMFVAVTVYVPAWLAFVILTGGFCEVELKPFGPTQFQPVAIPVEVPFNVIFCPVQVGFIEAIPATFVIVAFTATVTDAVVLPQTFVAVIVYVPAWPVCVIVIFGA